MVIANAGFSSHFGPSLDATPETYLSHYTVNTLAPLLLVRACLPLLTTSTSTSTNIPPSKFIAISSVTGSTARLTSATMRRNTRGQPRRGALPYTSSNCALNHVMARLYLEFPEVTVGLFTSGPTRTEFGGDGVDWEAMQGVHGVEEVVKGLVGLFDGVGSESESAGREEEGDGGLESRDWKGEVIAW